MRNITEEVGKITGVFISISEWIDLTARYKDINEDNNVPEFHKEIVRARMEGYKKKSGD
ncbi:MAG: hypothetical protein IPG79_03455 [Saprospiraceae bacterium]|nr:hypothetical protein [Saprospiraceae bacterium]